MTAYSQMPFQELLEFIVDNRGKTAPTSSSGVPLIATNCIKPGHLYPVHENVRYVSHADHATWFRAHPQPGDIIFVNKGTPGRTAMVPDPVGFCIAQDMVAVRPKPGVNNYYLLAALRSEVVQQQVDALSVGTTIPHLKKTDFDKLLIPVRSPAEQNAIGSMFAALSHRIEANRKLNETLEAICQTLFRSWFVDFDPVVAKSAGREPPHVSVEVARLFPSRIQETESGPMPEGWRRGEVGAEFELVMGQSPPGSTYNEFGDGMPFYQGRTDFKERYPTRRIYCTAPTRLAQPGDTLVSVRAPVGDTNQALEACALGRGVAAVRHPREKPSFTYYQMGALREEFDIYNGYGTLFGSINKGDFAKLPLVVPPPELVDRFEDVAGSLDAQLRNSILESQTLTSLRDALLPRLLSGELRVRQAEKLVEEAI